jgi:hypothetical protein
MATENGEKMKAKCDECGRVFDLFDSQEAEELLSGHDCEAY